MERLLHQFPLSHYCEKVRWILDYKGIPYRIHNQLPGLHALPNRRLTGRVTVPVLVESGQAISGSHAIALHLEASGQGASLIPQSATARLELQDLVAYFDDVVGPAVRRFVYGLITVHPALFAQVFFRDYSPAKRAFGTLLAAPLSKIIATMYGAHEPGTQELPALFRRAAERVERQLTPDSPFLLEDRLTLADITIASLFGPLVAPQGSPWTYDLDLPPLTSLREELRARPIGAYITALYGLHRRPAAIT